VAKPVYLSQTRDVGIQVGKFNTEPDKPVMVPLSGVSAVARGMGSNYRHPFREGEAEALRVSKFIPGAGEGTLFAGVGQERESKLRQSAIKT
jgi:hypothetical protein